MERTEKRYPFSMRKYGHNIELAYNHQWLICNEMENGERPYDAKAFEYFNKIQEVYANSIGHPVYFATGKEYGLLKEINLWAECHRDSLIYSK